MRFLISAGTLVACIVSTGLSSTSAAQTWFGSPQAPAGLNTADLVLVEDFEGASTLVDEAIEGTTSTVTNATSAGGQRCLSMDNSSNGLFSYRFPLGAGFDALYARYMFKVGNASSSCWGTDQHYKNMGFEGGTTECKGGSYVSDGTDCFTVRTRFNWPGIGFRIEGYPGNIDDTNGSVDVADGDWHCFEMLVRLNDPSRSDGEVRFWVDGIEKVHPGLQFRVVDTLKIDKWWFTYWSNDQFCGPLYIDDLVVSRARIGCPGTPPPPEAPRPMAPANVRVTIVQEKN